MRTNTTRIKQMGIRIKERRQFLKLSQEDLAGYAELTVQTVSNAERGARSLNQENLIRVAAILKVSVDYLLTGAIVGRDNEILLENMQKLPLEKKEIVESLLYNLIDDMGKHS